jgi:hypothetical protein
MKKLFTLIFIVATGFSTCLLAQSDQEENEIVTPRKYKNHIGVNSNAGYDYFKNNNVFIPIDLMYRRQISDNSSLRFGLGISQSIPNKRYYGLPWRSKHTYLAPSIGKEWEVNISQRWSFLYGADVKMTYFNYNSTTNQISRVDDGSYDGERAQLRENDITFFGGSFSPFIGLKWEFSKRFYLYAQTGFDLGYRRFSQEERTTELLDEIPLQSPTFRNSKGSFYNLQNSWFSGIQLNYKF